MLVVLWPWRLASIGLCASKKLWSLSLQFDAVSAVCPLGLCSGRSAPLTLDVAKMYRDDIAPDPGSLAREYGGRSAGTGVFCVRADAGKGVSARKQR
jgi:hypothetical protein